ncbi:RTA1 domain-containing protein [Aspergillus brunneoviolaceus CBS 621.78]|uniref:RTA1 domain protein n=1 Tax=Aspergillus brunneoviolaceus CBS 621.78 TaxID=1450534 RepID=A0ACD1GEN1_9EURO|nr:putative RTA1 domain protein [Aspergillus brunneoviolaceus CBS 621.78]RAH47682.1 putative RTA1 domain protein [Aspergillus brunneoviolaceus CBS 621.78]
MSEMKMDDCTLATCPIDLAYINYQPNIPANVLFLVIFGLLLAAQIALGTWFRTWTYMGAMTAGLILEILGYIGRVMMHSNPFDFNAFLLYLICLTIAPAFFTAAIYICLGRIVIVYGEGISRIRPRTYTILFVTCDIIALVLQAAGGAITSIADSDQKSLSDTGVNIMITGLAFQVASLMLFIVLASEFALRVRRSSEDMKNASTSSVRNGLKWQMFLLAYANPSKGLAIAVSTIFTRSIFRVAELKGGFSSDLANDEIALMILESTMIAIACICMTAAHPAVAMGRRWGEFSAKARRGVVSSKVSQASTEIEMTNA